MVLKVASMSREQRKWLEDNHINFSHLSQDVIDILRGTPNPLYGRLLTGLHDRILEENNKKRENK